ncbi:MAG: hypothetical protein J5827_04130 [Oscillospiraceae bacterium]|nr:hypothetical protein [Oscillospiraceae bacterium]
MRANGSTFVEQIVRRRRPGGESVFRACCILAGAALAAASFFLFGPFFPIALAVLAAAEYFCLVYGIKEYEYSFLDGEVTFELIRGKRRRKRLFSCSCREISEMAPAPPGGVDKAGFAAVYDVSASASDRDRWFFTAEGTSGRMLVFLSPNERMLGAFGEYLGRKMRSAADK